MPKSSRKQCVSCGAIHFRNDMECWRCYSAKKNDENPRYCVLCGGRIPRKTGRGSSQYCSPTCANAVGDARTDMVSRLVAKHVRAGAIKPASELVCVDCGAQGKDYDHREYLKPLQVVPVCRSCNLRRGPADDIKAFVAKHLCVGIDSLSKTLLKRKAIQEAEMADRRRRWGCGAHQGAPDAKQPASVSRDQFFFHECSLNTHERNL